MRATHNEPHAYSFVIKMCHPFDYALLWFSAQSPEVALVLVIEGSVSQPLVSQPHGESGEELSDSSHKNVSHRVDQRAGNMADTQGPFVEGNTTRSNPPENNKDVPHPDSILVSKVNCVNFENDKAHYIKVNLCTKSRTLVDGCCQVSIHVVIQTETNGADCHTG